MTEEELQLGPGSKGDCVGIVGVGLLLWHLGSQSGVSAEATKQARRDPVTKVVEVTREVAGVE